MLIQAMNCQAIVRRVQAPPNPIFRIYGGKRSHHFWELKIKKKRNAIIFTETPRSQKIQPRKFSSLICVMQQQYPATIQRNCKLGKKEERKSVSLPIRTEAMLTVDSMQGGQGFLQFTSTSFTMKYLSMFVCRVNIITYLHDYVQY